MMRMLLFWFAVLSPKERLAFLVAIAVFIYAMSR